MAGSSESEPGTTWRSANNVSLREAYEMEASVVPKSLTHTGHVAGDLELFLKKKRRAAFRPDP